MAVLCICSFSSLCCSPQKLKLFYSSLFAAGVAFQDHPPDTNSTPIIRSRSSTRILVLSSHSNPNILKSNRRSRFGHALSTYDSDQDQDFDDDDDDDNNGVSDDDLFSEDEFAVKKDSDAGAMRFKSRHAPNAKQGKASKVEYNPRKRLLNKGSSARAASLRHSQSGWGLRSQLKGNFNIIEDRLEMKKAHDSLGKKTIGSLYNNTDGTEKLDKRTERNRYPRLSEELELDEKWLPLLDYLTTFGLKESHFIQMYERHMPSFQINVDSACERLEFLLGVGVKRRDIRKILLRQPQILGYTVENNLRPHVAFLQSLGIPDSRIGQILSASPSIFSYSLENSLKPTVRYLLEEVGIKKSDLSKVVQLSPQILVQRIESSWNNRLRFLTRELGAPRDCTVKMVTKHPQLLHYSIEDGLLPRINFLRSIGMHNSDILKVLTSLTQVLSLSLEGNLKPKYLYLINELQNEVQSLTKYPMYLSLSLDQRIRPRHKFLVALKKAPKGPFPLSSLVPTDESFCQQWAGTTVDKYVAFRQRLLLKEFAKKYERQ